MWDAASKHRRAGGITSSPIPSPGKTAMVYERVVVDIVVVLMDSAMKVSVRINVDWMKVFYPTVSERFRSELLRSGGGSSIRAARLGTKFRPVPHFESPNRRQ